MTQTMMAVQQHEQSAMTRKSKSKRTKQRSLTKAKLLLKPLAVPHEDTLDESGRTVLSNGSEFFGTNDNGSNRLKSCVKKNKTAAPRKSVSFDSIEEREHAIILGDNPSVTSGPPLTIAWESHASFHSSVEEYEEAHPTRRSKEHMLIPRHVREEWLRNAGYARSHFAAMERSVQKIKRQRAASAQSSFISKVFGKGVK